MEVIITAPCRVGVSCGRAPPRLPATDGVLRFDAATHASVAPKHRSYPAALNMLEACAPDMLDVIASNRGSKGAVARGRGCRGGGPPRRPPRRRTGSIQRQALGHAHGRPRRASDVYRPHCIAPISCGIMPPHDARAEQLLFEEQRPMPRGKQSRGQCAFCGYATTKGSMSKHLAACPQRMVEAGEISSAQIAFEPTASRGADTIDKPERLGRPPQHARRHITGDHADGGVVQRQN
jgi:hypothetical protein